MMDILYTLIIFPLETVIDITYLIAWRIFRNPAMALFGVSMAVSILTLPLYFMAERHQRAERDIQKILKPEVDNIKAVFRGDEQYMMLASWYRKNNYHPVYALRSSLGLIIQIPFFIAAYHFIVSLDQLKNVSFLFIKDLSAGDGALQFGGMPVNVLPILMTVINVVSGAVYARGLAFKEKAQLYGMAAVFLALLYNSPSALVLYWTANNLFSLVKNILQKTKNSGKIIYVIISLFGIVLAVYVLFFHGGALKKRLAVTAVLLLTLFMPLWKQLFRVILSKLKSPVTLENTALGSGKTFFFSSIALFLLAGLVIPSGIIASSVSEFSFIEPYTSPLPFVWITLLQSGGILLWAVCAYFLFDRRIKRLLTCVMTLTLGVFMLNAFLFGGSYGFMMPDLQLSDFSGMPWRLDLINLCADFVLCMALFFLLIIRKKVLLFSMQNIITAALFVLGLLNVLNIVNTFSVTNPVEQIVPQSEKVYTFSKTGRNVLLIDLDRAISGYVPYIFDEKPELLQSFGGFTYYPNCVSFGGFTIYGTPAIFGGYSYTPFEIQKRKNEPFLKKYYESMQVLPRILADSGFDVTVSDQPWMDNDLYDEYNNIKTIDIMGRYTDFFLRQNKDISSVYYYQIIRSNLIRFSFFKFMPFIFRGIVYDNGKYLHSNKDFDDKIGYSKSAIRSYASLYYLPEITGITEENKDFAVMLVNDLTHEPAFFQAPEYVPAPEITDKGSGPFANEDHYHANMAAFLLLGKWFDFLKENGVYDNTKIIIVSDHGRDIRSPFPDNIMLPNGMGLEFFTALLMVKDFSADWVLRTSDTFMTNADVPLLATAGIIHNPVNPFNGETLAADKEQGVTITTAHRWQLEMQGKYLYNIESDEWLQVHDSIFEPENWNKITP